MSQHDAACLLGIGTALPQYRSSQAVAGRFSTRVLEAQPAGAERDAALELVERIYPRCGIEERASVIPDYMASDPRDFVFYPRSWSLEPFPTTSQRMRLYEEASLPVAEAAARQALSHAGVAAIDVTHVVLCTCTGLFAPGPDVLLVGRLGLRAVVERVVVGFMGCYGGLSGLRLADRLVRADPGAIVLQVCVELCSLHFQKRPEPDFVVANCLFADGCAAAVYGRPGVSSSRAAPLAVVGATATHVDTAGLGDMSWRIGDTGFEMRISTRVPAALRSTAPGLVGDLLARGGLRRADVGRWAIHPGGWRIVEAVGAALGLGSADLAASLEVLRRHGNMSSATIFFVLQSIALAGTLPEPTVAIGFGPGLTVEGALLKPWR